MAVSETRPETLFDRHLAMLAKVKPGDPTDESWEQICDEIQRVRNETTVAWALREGLVAVHPGNRAYAALILNGWLGAIGSADILRIYWRMTSDDELPLVRFHLAASRYKRIDRSPQVRATLDKLALADSILAGLVSELRG